MYHKSDEQSLKITPQAATSHEKQDLTEVFFSKMFSKMFFFCLLFSLFFLCLFFCSFALELSHI